MHELTTTGFLVAVAAAITSTAIGVLRIPPAAQPLPCTSAERRMDDALERLRHYDLLLNDAGDRVERLRSELRQADKDAASVLQSDLDRAVQQEHTLRQRRGILRRIIARTAYVLEHGTTQGAERLWPETDTLDVSNI